MTTKISVPSAPVSSAPATKTKKTRQRRPWAPDKWDLEVFDAVRMLGQTQQEVALAWGISHSTVSRIVTRVERWQSHAQPREAGRLDHGERLRAQLWLTYERNERLLASCLRLAAR